MVTIANDKMSLLDPERLITGAKSISSNVVKILVFGSTNSGKSTFMTMILKNLKIKLNSSQNPETSTKWVLRNNNVDDQIMI